MTTLNLIWIVRCAAALSAVGASLGIGAPLPPASDGVVKQYCVGCHNSKVKSGAFALDALIGDDVTRHPEAWEKAIRKLRARQMPPAGLPRPSEPAYGALLSSLESALDGLAGARPNPGRTDTFRRLNRTEYHNAIRDLLAIDVDVTSLLPGDEAGHGFDNVTVGDLSPTLLERYLSAARKISRLAVGTPIRAPGGVTIQVPPDLTQEQHFDELPFGTRGGAVVKHTFPLDAAYEFLIRLARDRNEEVEGLREPHEVELMLDGERVQLFTVTPPPRGTGHSLVDKDLKIRMPVKAGPHEIAVAFLKRPSTLVYTERKPYQARFNMYRHPRLQPAVYSVTINGPYEATGPGDTPSRRRLFVCQPANPAEEPTCAKRIFATLMRRAYRRPVTDADSQLPLKFYQEARTQGEFDAGIEMGLSAVLVNPEFIFRVEQDPPGASPNSAYRVSDLETASRLSFFLWSSIPDDELLEAAIAGTLSTPAAYEKQVRRMLADHRSRALVNNFAEQWLYLRNLASISPDMRLFADFDDNLRRAFRQETEMLFETVMHEDRSILDLVRAKFTFVNERLARHYGIPNIYGSHFRRIELEPDSHRGGLLRQGSILTVTSYANRTSPVIRGNWILSNILGTPAPPPPGAVPTLKENSSGASSLLMRQRMAEHRKNPACSGCHQLMDPVGFSLENYDAIGRWRAQEANTPIDASGGLPDGSQFEGIAGLEQAILKRPELFATTFTEKLLTYALGRGVEYYDAPAVRKIVHSAGANDFRFSSFILGIVNSTPFQMRRAQ